LRLLTPPNCRSVRRSLAAVFAGLAVLALVWPLTPAAAQDADAGKTVQVNGTGDTVRVAGAAVEVTGEAKSIWAAGATVAVDAVATDSLWVAGADVTIVGAVGKSIHAAGSRVAVSGVAGAWVWLAGGDVRAGLTTGSDLFVAGGNVVLGPAANVGGTLSAAGGNIVITGRIRGDARIAGGSVTLNGRFDGAVTVAAERLFLGPRAEIGGDLVLMLGTEIERAPGATVTGETRTVGVGSWRLPEQLPLTGSRIVVALFLFGATTVTGIGLMVLMRGTYGEAARTARSHPGSSLIFGVLLLVLIPVAAVFLAITVAGLPLALILFLSLPMLVIVGYAVAALSIADGLFSGRDARVGVLAMLIFLLIGALIFAGVGMIPYAGPIFVLVLLVIGCGAFGRVAWRRLRRPIAVESAST